MYEQVKLSIPPANALREHERSLSVAVRQRIAEGKHTHKSGAVERVHMGRWRYYLRALKRMVKAGRWEYDEEHDRYRLTPSGARALAAMKTPADRH